MEEPLRYLSFSFDSFACPNYLECDGIHAQQG